MDFIPLTFDTFSKMSSPIPLEVLKLLVCFIGASTDIIMIYIILKSKNLKKYTSIYIINWLIADALLILVKPAEYDVVTYLDIVHANQSYICIFHSLSSIIRSVELVSILVLIFQCLFDKSVVTMFDSQSMRVVSIVWFLGLLEAIFVGYTCLYSVYHTNFGNIILPILLIILINSFLVLHCRLGCTNPYNSSLVVSLITTYISWWSMVSVLAIINAVLQIHFVMLIYEFVIIFVYLYPIIMFYVFYKIDKDFEICLRYLLNNELEGKEEMLVPQETEMEEIKING